MLKYITMLNIICTPPDNWTFDILSFHAICTSCVTHMFFTHVYNRNSATMSFCLLFSHQWPLSFNTLSPLAHTSLYSHPTFVLLFYNIESTCLFIPGQLHSKNKIPQLFLAFFLFSFAFWFFSLFVFFSILAAPPSSKWDATILRILHTCKKRL